MENSEAIEIWKRAVETQMHFNEMSTKSRQLGLTLVVAALGLSAVLLGRGDDFSLVMSAGSVPIKINVAVLIILASALGMYGVQRLDLGVYHQMLRGAVKFGEEFEQRHLVDRMNTPQGMTQLISIYSRNRTVTKKDAIYVGSDGDSKTAGDKLKQFYRLMIISIVTIAGVVFLVTQVSSIERPATPTAVVSPK
jgi:hypothetical protein